MTDTDERRERLRFEDFQLVRLPNGRSLIRVVLDWTEDRSFRGEAEGNQTLEGEVRASAEATLKAASAATGRNLRLELRGTKALRVFDSWIVVVMVQAAWADSTALRLLGAYPCPDEDTARGAVLAFLDATNRIVPLFLSA